jgi:Zn-finger nucleic acid-binding protein
MKHGPPDKGTTSALVSEAGADVVCVQSLSQEIEQADCNPHPRISGPASTIAGADVNALALVKDLRRIITETRWTPAERIAFATLVLAADKTDGNWRPIEMPACKLAEQIGISDRSTRDALAKFEAEGLVSRHVERIPMNRYGEQIPTKAVNVRNGDIWRTETTIAVAAKLPDALPALAESSNQKRARETASAARREFAETKTTLDNLLSGLACPHCGEVGHLHGEISATCNACGVHIDAGELAELIDGETMPTEPAKFSTPDNNGNRQSFPHTVSYPAKFSTPDEALSIRGEAQPVFDVLTGEATIRYLAGLGAAFSLADGKAGVNLRSDDGMDELNYLDAPVTAETAIAHLKRGGTVGMLPEHSPGFVVIDDDMSAGDFIRKHGAVAMGPRIWRANAPDRIKLIVLCPDAGDSMTFESADKSRRIEIISKRKHAIIAGTHESGAAIECEVAHEIPLIEWSRLIEIARDWTGTPASQHNTRAHPLSASSAATTRLTSDQVKPAIVWWCQQPQNIAAVDALVKTRAKGKYTAVRPERTPSTRITGEYGGRRTWRDYGSSETLDDYEIYCRLSGIDKRTHKWEIVNEWRTAQGMAPLNLHSSAHEHFKRTPQAEAQL